MAGKFDKNGIHEETGTSFDPNGFDFIGIHKDTKSRFDPYGYDMNGFDEFGYNEEGMHRDTGTEFNTDGFDSFDIHEKTGTRFDPNGFTADGIHKDTKTRFNPQGYDRNGIDKYGYREGQYNYRGYNQEGIHRDTGTKFNPEGFDRDGIHEKTGTEFDPEGFNASGYDHEGYNRRGYNSRGRDKGGYYESGFNDDLIHKDTGTEYDQAGYNHMGYNSRGYDKRGHDKSGFNEEGIHWKTGTNYTKSGYDKDGYRKDGFNKIGIHRETGTKFAPNGYDRNGYDEKQFHITGIHKITGTIYDLEGYTREGYNELGHNREGIFKATGTLYGEEGFNRYGINREGIDRSTGQKNTSVALVEDYLAAKTSMQLFCKKRDMLVPEFQKTLQYVKAAYPGITEEDVKKASQRSSEVYLHKRRGAFQKLISGEVTMDEYVKSEDGIVKFEDLLQEAKTEEDTTKLYKVVGTHMASGQMRMGEYLRLFVKGRPNYGAYLVMMGEKNVPGMFDEVHSRIKYMPELRGLVSRLHTEKRRLEGHRRKDTKLEKIGYIDKETGEEHLMDVTEKHIEFAKTHLRNSGEYICGLTIEGVLKQMARGELTFESIDEEAPPKVSNIEAQMEEQQRKKEELATLQAKTEVVETKIERVEEVLSKSGIGHDGIKQEGKENRNGQ